MREPRNDPEKTGAVKQLYTFLGSVSLVLGIMGIFLPLLPTTPFLLLSAALWMKGSPRMYDWLTHHKHLGPYIRNFREYKAIPMRAKVLSVALVWITLLYSAFFLFENPWMRTAFIALAAGISWHILSYRTLKTK